MAIIDLRSDTVTSPTLEMREAMRFAEVGDDVFGEDPTVNALELKIASLFNQEAALFCPSGTQANQIAIAAWTQPGDEVICSQLAHIYLYEGGGIAANAGCSVRLIGDERGMFGATDVRSNINNPHDAHLPMTKLVSVEDSVNKGGGAVWDVEEIKRIRQVCIEKGLKLHCDGARIFNALAVSGNSSQEYGKLFDSISICLSKGLGAPVGSVLTGSAEFIRNARRIRKRFGGGMRQAGILAAAGIYALDHHVDRLKVDHRRARRVADMLAELDFVKDVMPVQTNIVIFSLNEKFTTAAFIEQLKEYGVRCFSFGPDKIRFVFHLEITDQMTVDLEQILRKMT